MSLADFGIGDVFLLAWALGVLAFVGGVIEGLAVHRLHPWAFRFGIPVLRLRRSLPALEALSPAGGFLRTEHARLRLLQNGSAVFTGEIGSLLRFHTPFPLKGSVHPIPNGQMVVARAPLGPTVFFLAWVIAMGITGSIGPVVIGGLIVVLILRYERDRALRLVEEVARAAPAIRGGV
jgi:hypothetical protein